MSTAFIRTDVALRTSSLGISQRYRAMTDSVRFIGPRGWAALVLASGAALSAPFLRNPSSAQSSSPQPLGALPQVDSTNLTWPNLNERSLTPPQVATDLNEQDWEELSRLQKISGASPRKVTGDLPSTLGVAKLPAWADRGPRVDLLVRETLRTDTLPPLSDVNINASLQPLRPWMGEGLKTAHERDNSRPAEISNELAYSQPDYDSRWSTANTIDTSSEAGNSGASSSNGSLVRKFENHVAQWPDEIMAPAQFFERTRQAALASRDATRPEVNWPTNAGATQPLGAPYSDAGASHQFAQTEIKAPVALMPPGLASENANATATVSAPMISSQSARPIRRPPDQSIEATKSKSDTTRTKHFIQQPSKRT